MTDELENKQKWYANAILIKLAVIGAIVLALLIPSSWIQDLIVQREGYQSQQLSRVTSGWAGTQLVQGPVLVLPFKKAADAKNTETQYIYLLPQNLKIKAGIKTELYQHGVYDATVYNSQVQIQGNFTQPDLARLGIDAQQVMFDKARLIFGISDIKGLKNTPVVNIDGHNYNAEPAFDKSAPFDNSLQVSLNYPANASAAFSYQLDVKGSNELNFLNTGTTTDVEVNSDRKHPDFTGRALPDSRVVVNNGSQQKWHMVAYNRPFPQQWINNTTLLSSNRAKSEAVFGVNLRLPIDQYRKVLRTAKYDVLVIALTFVSLFFTELIRRQRVHLINYVLIGAAMVVYYTLLLSFSEQLGYNLAYLVSSLATIGLISVFTASLLQNRQAAVLFAFILSIFYGFIFVIIQLEELSLMVGSIALFLIVAALMYFSRKINWDTNNNKTLAYDTQQ